ncbi:MAG: dethiobiotin synthase [Deltaproteobacteria bacterium]|nr:dethiobiotin synthase [Deltaproteobacteria bacterium]
MKTQDKKTRRARGIFISGTDTGVGKTIVAAAIALYLRKAGIRVAVLKPVTSGAVVIDGRLCSEDAELLRWASRCAAPDADIAPYLLREPLAPSESAAREGVVIRIGPIREAFERLCVNHDFVIVEGAGGLLVPLAKDLLVADLVEELSLPLLIVARPNLGTVNHTLMTCECARSRGIEIIGVVINGQSDQPDSAEEYAPRVISHYGAVSVSAVLPRCAAGNEKLIVETVATSIEKQPLAALLPLEVSHENP